MYYLVRDRTDNTRGAGIRRSPPVLVTLVRRLWALILGLVLGSILGGLVSISTQPAYEASTVLGVLPSSSMTAGSSMPSSYLQAYSSLIADPTVAREAVARSGVEVDPQELTKFVTLWIEPAPNVPLLRVSVSSRRPEDASDLANALGSAISSAGEQANIDDAFRTEVVLRALPPTSPVRPNWTLNTAVGAATGLLIGSLVALFWDDVRRPPKKV